MCSIRLQGLAINTAHTLAQVRNAEWGDSTLDSLKASASPVRQALKPRILGQDLRHIRSPSNTKLVSMSHMLLNPGVLRCFLDSCLFAAVSCASSSLFRNSAACSGLDSFKKHFVAHGGDRMVAVTNVLTLLNARPMAPSSPNRSKLLFFAHEQDVQPATPARQAKVLSISHDFLSPVTKCPHSIHENGQIVLCIGGDFIIDSIYIFVYNHRRPVALTIV